MGRIVRRGKKFFIQNTRTGVLGRSFVNKINASKALTALRRRLRRR